MAWWNREVRIWRFESLIKAPRGAEKSLSQSEHRSPRLVARLAIKVCSASSGFWPWCANRYCCVQGDENITSASLSASGNLLAVSTSSEVKMFRLGLPNADGEVLKIRRLEVPPCFSKMGGRLVQFSPDTQWLCIVTPDSRIRLARVLVLSKSPEGATIVPKVFKLKRLRRPIPDPEAAADGGLGPYERTITRVSFSPNSANLAVSDLSGYIDTWFISRHDVSERGADGLDNELSSSSSADEDSDVQAESSNRTAVGDHWIRNPSASLIPHLGSAVLVLSFFPVNDRKRIPQANHTGRRSELRLTRPKSPGYTSVAEGRLFVLTALHQMYVFDISNGRLSRWSKRNPTSCLPSRFRRWHDRAMGCVWDVGDRGKRIWLYGSSWLCMLDLHQDLPRESGRGQVTEKNTPLSKKRKHAEIEDDRAEHTSGAGGKVPDSELMTGIGSTMGKFTGPVDDEKEVIPLDSSRRHDSDSASEEEAAGDVQLALTRRAARPRYDSYRPRAKGYRATNDVPLWRGDPFWATTRYRPIMAVVPIGGPDDEHERRHWVAPGHRKIKDLPVALIERPLWEVDLPPRFYEDHEQGNK